MILYKGSGMKTFIRLVRKTTRDKFKNVEINDIVRTFIQSHIEQENRWFDQRKRIRSIHATLCS